MRYFSHSADDINKMLGVIGVESLEELFKDIPDNLKFDRDLDIPKALTEWELNEYFDSLSEKSYKGKILLGAGSYNHYIPEVINYLASRSEFLTSYTPYQPEISQGTLQALFEFQTYISDYLGMDYSNASMYDGATSFAEAILLSIRVTKLNKVVISKGINPRYREVLRSYSEAAGFKIIVLDYNKWGKTDFTCLPDLEEVAAIAIQSPNYFGVVEDLEKIRPIIGKNKTLFISVFSEILSFGLYRPPGEYDSDIVCGEAQSFGIPMAFGGPSLGVFTFKKKYLRSVPGRLVGETLDQNGRRSYCLTLATREQHIRRERATSNICSNQGLNTLRTLIYMSLLGGKGLKKLAQINYNSCEYLKEKLRSIGCRVVFEAPTFNEFVVKYPKSFDYKRVCSNGFHPGVKLEDSYKELTDCYLVAVTETLKKDDLDNFVKIVGGYNDL